MSVTQPITLSSNNAHFRIAYHHASVVVRTLHLSRWIAAALRKAKIALPLDGPTSSVLMKQ